MKVKNYSHSMIKIGLIGFGNVGQGVFKILTDNAALIENRVETKLSIAKVIVRNPKKYAKEFPTLSFSANPDDVLNDPEIAIIVEVMGGENPAFDIICKALKNKKYVVTANKEVISKHKTTFFKLAKENQVDIYYEAAVGGGIPIIRSLKIGFAANRIDSLYGILNGTTNYILTKIEETQRDFQDVLKDAQRLGFAEADPSMDIEGTDAAYKLTILAAVAFKANITLKDVYCEGITKISLTDLKYAKELGYTIKLLAQGNRHENNGFFFGVFPQLVPHDHPLAGIRNETNAVYIVGNAVGEALLSGKGAGGSPTGSAIVSDLIDIAFDASHKTTGRNLEINLEKAKLQSVQDTQYQYYFRLSLQNEPHSLEKMSRIFSNASINIQKLIQKENTGNEAEVVILTGIVKEKACQTVITKLQKESFVKQLHNVIRVWKG